MKRIIVLCFVAFFICAGCAGMQENKRTTAGAVAGSAAGAGLGYALGNGQGAALGAVTGGLAGGVIGQMMDSQERELQQAVAESQARDQAAAMSAVQREKDAIILSFKSDVLFDKNSSVLKPGVYSSGEIDRVAHIVNRYPDTKIRVEGYNDNTGSDSYNQQLSEQRAIMVKNSLITKNVDAARITAIGLGKSYPVADNGSEAGRQLNRRVAIVIQPSQQQPAQVQPPVSQGTPEPQYQQQNQPPVVYTYPPTVIYGSPLPVYYAPPYVYGGYYYDPYYYGYRGTNIYYYDNHHHDNHRNNHHGHR
jgi:outer membrane protein OmpA-like peptidoglycan-associated protein